MSDCANARSCDCDPTFDVAAPNPPPPPVVWWNARQCATASCSAGLDGDPVTMCVEANTVSSTVNQSDADAQAYALALQQATNALNCGLAGQLNGLLWLLPITSVIDANFGHCTDPADQTAIAQGAIGQTYSVHLRIRGVVELKHYSGDGVGGSGSSYLFTCSNTSQAIPAAGGDTQNEYALVISNPAQTYFLNNTPSGAVSPVGIDYQMVVSVTTGATVTLKARSIDAAEWRNISSTVVNNAPAPILVSEPYNGQFLQLDVQGVF